MVYVRLPMEITCDQCILQWSYVAGKVNTVAEKTVNTLSTKALLK